MADKKLVREISNNVAKAAIAEAMDTLEYYRMSNQVEYELRVIVTENGMTVALNITRIVFDEDDPLPF